MTGSFFLSSADPLVAGFVAFARTSFWFMFAIHAAECAAFLPRLQRAPGSTASHVLQTLLFGGFHVRETPRSAA